MNNKKNIILIEENATNALEMPIQLVTNKSNIKKDDNGNNLISENVPNDENNTEEYSKIFTSEDNSLKLAVLRTLNPSKFRLDDKL